MGDFSQFGKMFLIIGLVMAGIGVFLLAGDKIPWLGRLPGDLLFKGKKVSFYFPITTCILISVLLTLVLYLFRHK
jgi:hypothetical protein